MAEREIIWSQRAEDELKEILDYYIVRNKSVTFSLKLLSLFTTTIQRIAVIPELGLSCENSSSRIFILKEYVIVYE
ncbi:MAG: type II toxin-antitoxin system RelE/ParE family toxin, partial [Cryomorphaceae bacterium]